MRAARKGNAWKRPIQDMLSHTGLNTTRHIWNLQATQLGGQSARLASIPTELGLGLNSRSIRIVLLDAIPIRQFNAVFGTGFGSVFPRLKC